MTLVCSNALSVFGYGDVLHVHAAPSTLKTLGTVYHGALHSTMMGSELTTENLTRM